MSSTIFSHQAIGSYGRHLRSLGIRQNLQQSLRLATTNAKTSAGKSVLSKNKSVPATKKTRFTAKSSGHAIKTSQPASARSPSTPVPLNNTSRTGSTPDSTSYTPSSTETFRPPRTREFEVEEEPHIQMPLDPNSKEYKQAYNGAARRWTAIIVSIPLLFVTSYYLYKRLATTVGARPSQSKHGRPSSA